MMASAPAAHSSHAKRAVHCAAMLCHCMKSHSPKTPISARTIQCQRAMGLDSELQRDLVGIAPAPRLARLECRDDRVPGRVVVLGGVLVLRAVAAADVAA